MTKLNKIENALIIGGTGMLAEASAHLAQISNNLTIASRNPHALAVKLKANPLELDWENLSEANVRLDKILPCDLIVSWVREWVQEEGLGLITPLEALLKPGGRSIRVHGCESADPKVREKVNAGSRTDINRQTVILGWINQPEGARWLTHSEISQGVIHTINSPQLKNFVVGSLEPTRPLF